MRVLVADPLSEAGLRVLRVRGLEVEVRTGLSEEGLAAAVADADALIVRSASKVTRRVLEAGTRLRVVGRAGVGVDNIDEAAATERGVLVLNTPHGNTLSATEHTWALLLALARRVPQAVASLKAGHWDRKTFSGVELNGKTLGVVGYGRIGREVAARARAFGMRVVAHDPYINADLAREAGVELAALRAVVEQADFLTLHTPLTSETQRLLGESELRSMKKGSYLLNVARGDLVDESALAAVLREGHLAGAALDVFQEEPPRNLDLLSIPTFIGTPHLGASTAEAQEKVAVQVAEFVADYLTEGKIASAVNLPFPLPPAVRPFVELAWGMGSFAAQLAGGNPGEVRVTCRGEVARQDTHAVAASALAGVLGRSDERINLVNAEGRARQQGVRFVQSRTESIEDYASSVEVHVRTGAGEATLLGTTFHRIGPMIVEVNGYEVDFKPYGRFLLIQHRDQPGTVAKISSVLGAENINIAQMVVGRAEPRGPAVSVLRVDDPVPQRVLEEIRAALGLPGVIYVTVPRPGDKAEKRA